MAITRCDAAGFRLMLGLALCIATVLALTPQPVGLPDVPLADKWAHLATYLVLAFLVDASWPERDFGAGKCAALLGYGLLIEIAQSQIPSRMFSIGDLVANAAGIGLYALLVVRALRAMRIR